ncbi:MAG: cytochrome c maturation protein CcmE [Anaerolineae bacterium]
MNNKRNFVVAGVLILAAVVYLIVSSTGSTASFFLTIEELEEMGSQAQERNLTVSGAVIGETIIYDASKPRVTFTIVQIPGDLKEIEARGGLAAVLAAAVDDPDAASLNVVYDGARPDLLQDEAQAIVRGRLHADGTFHADELLLKCPSRYAEELPEQRAD